MINLKRNILEINEKSNNLENINSSIKRNKSRNFIHRKTLSEIDIEIETTNETKDNIYEVKQFRFDCLDRTPLIEYDYEFLESISKKNKKRTHYRSESNILFESTNLNMNRKNNLIIPKMEIIKLTIPLKKQLKIFTPRSKNEDNCNIF